MLLAFQYLKAVSKARDNGLLLTEPFPEAFTLSHTVRPFLEQIAELYNLRPQFGYDDTTVAAVVDFVRKNPGVPLLNMFRDRPRRRKGLQILLGVGAPGTSIILQVQGRPQQLPLRLPGSGHTLAQLHPKTCPAWPGSYLNSVRTSWIITRLSSLSIPSWTGQIKLCAPWSSFTACPGPNMPLSGSTKSKRCILRLINCIRYVFRTFWSLSSEMATDNIPFAVSRPSWLVQESEGSIIQTANQSHAVRQAMRADADLGQQLLKMYEEMGGHLARVHKSLAEHAAFSFAVSQALVRNCLLIRANLRLLFITGPFTCSQLGSSLAVHRCQSARAVPQ